jgi:RNA polymerase sigma factor (sigma-70 family)
VPPRHGGAAVGQDDGVQAQVRLLPHRQDAAPGRTPQMVGSEMASAPRPLANEGKRDYAAGVSEDSIDRTMPVVPAGGLAALWHEHRGELLRFLAARSDSPADAEDLLQELWLRVARASPGPIASPRAYLFRIANNIVLDQRRGQLRAMARDRAWLAEQGGDSAAEHRPDPALAPDDALAQRQEAEMLRAAIAKLPRGAAQVLRLFRLEGLTHGEIAAQLGISRSGVEKHLALAMRRLRDALSDCEDFAAAASLHGDGSRTGGKRQDQQP